MVLEKMADVAKWPEINPNVQKRPASGAGSQDSGEAERPHLIRSSAAVEVLRGRGSETTRTARLRKMVSLSQAMGATNRPRNLGYTHA